MKNIKLFITLAFITLLTACASTPINHEALKQNKIDTISYSAPATLAYTVSDSSAAGASAGGLLGAVIAGGIDAGINSKRAKAFEPILEKIAGYDTQSVFGKKLAALKGPFFADSINTIAEEPKKVTDRKLHELQVNGQFQLSPNHRSVITMIKANLKVNNENDLNGNFWVAESKMDMGGVKVEKADVTQFWLDNPEELQKHIENSMDKAITEMVKYFSTPK